MFDPDAILVTILWWIVCGGVAVGVLSLIVTIWAIRKGGLK